MNKKKQLYVIIIVLALASIIWRLITYKHLEQTSLLFVGIPTFMSLIVVKYSKTPKSAYGVAFKTLTLFLLICAVFFGEGLICIIFMAPIFYGITALIIYIISLLDKKSKKNINSFVLIPVLFVLISPTEIGSQPEVIEIITSKIISNNHSIDNLKTNPDNLKKIPTVFTIGFPTPIKIEGNGVSVGEVKKIHFESQTKGIGILQLRVTHKDQNSITYAIEGDSTHINHWLTWKEIKVNIIKNKDNTQTVTWSTQFTCDLGPSWYFEILEYKAVEIMNEHLINSYF